MKLRWLVGKLKQESSHNWCGKQWKNEWELHAEKILQYSLDGKTWEDVECEYFEVPQEEVHKYKWK